MFYAGQRLTAAELNATIPQVVYITGQLVNSTASTPVSGAGWTVAPGQYNVTGLVFCTQGATLAQQALGISGPAVSSVDISVVNVDTSSGGSGGSADMLGGAELITMGSRVALGPSSGISVGHTWIIQVSGTVTFTAAGTFQFTASCVTSSADTWTIRGGQLALIQG